MSNDLQRLGCSRREARICKITHPANPSILKILIQTVLIADDKPIIRYS
jgi:hypothetical protein